MRLERVVCLVLARVVARREAEPVARDGRRVLHEQHHHLLRVRARVWLGLGVGVGVANPNPNPKPKPNPNPNSNPNPNPNHLLALVEHGQVEGRVALGVRGVDLRAVLDQLQRRLLEGWGWGSG